MAAKPSPSTPQHGGVVPQSQHVQVRHRSRRWPELYAMDVGDEVTYPEESVIKARDTTRRITHKYKYRFDWRINDDGSITITRVA